MDKKLPNKSKKKITPVPYYTYLNDDEFESNLIEIVYKELFRKVEKEINNEP
jgi:hypothetical protein